MLKQLKYLDHSSHHSSFEKNSNGEHHFWKKKQGATSEEMHTQHQRYLGGEREIQMKTENLSRVAKTVGPKSNVNKSKMRIKARNKGKIKMVELEMEEVV